MFVRKKPVPEPDVSEATIEALIAACRRIDGRRAIRKMLPRVAAAFGCDHCGVHRVMNPKGKGFLSQIETTYPKSWLLRYTIKGYIAVDPVLETSEEWRDLFYWDETRRTSPRVQRFFEDAAKHGIGPTGITDIHAVPDNGAIAVSLSSTRSPKEFRDWFEPRVFDYRNVARALAFAFFRCNVLSASEALESHEHTFLSLLLNGGNRAEAAEAVGYALAEIEQSIARKTGCASFDQALLVIGQTGLLESPEFILHSLTAD